MYRSDNRSPEQLRPVNIIPEFISTAEGSVLIEVGNTLRHLYRLHRGERASSSCGTAARAGSMLRICNAAPRDPDPNSTGSGGKGEAERAHPRNSAPDWAVAARCCEISRVLENAPCGLTATSSRPMAERAPRRLPGAFVALGLALEKLVEAGTLTSVPLRDFVAAISVGIVDGEILLDLCYEEDSRADVDMNFVMTAGRKLVEVQATAEHQVFDEQHLAKMIALAGQGVQSLIAKQQAILPRLTLRQ